MALAINIMGGHGLSNKVSCEHLPKETKGDAVLAVRFISGTFKMAENEQQGETFHL